MALVALLAIGVAALRAEGGRPASDSMSAAGTGSSTTATTAFTQPGGTGVVSISQEGMEAAELVLIDTRDPEESNDDEVVLVSMDGVEQGRGPLNGWHPSHPDQGADVRPMQGGFVLTAAPPLDGPVPGCGAVHGSAGLRVAVCGRGRAPDEIRRIDLYGQERHLAGPVDTDGHWRFAFLSPDGAWVLAQWSGCDSPGAFLIDVSSSERVPVAALELSSLAIGWSTDGQAIVGTPDGGCSAERSERGTYLVDPESLERRRLHELIPVTRLTGDYEWSGNRLERVMSRAWRDRNLEPLGGQPSHGGGDAEAGIVFDGHDIGIWAVPLDELPPDWEAPDELTFTCGSDRYFLADWGPSGSTEDPPAPDWHLLERAAQRLVPGLYCTLGAHSDRPGVPMDEEILFAFRRHGSTWAVGRASGTEYRLTHGPGDSGPAVGPDRSTTAFGRRDYEGVYDETIVLDARRGRAKPIGIAGVAAFSTDGQLAVGEPVDDDLADTEIVVREPGSWSETARITLGPQREVGSVVDLAWDVDNRSLLASVAHWNLPDRPAGTALWWIDTVGASAHRLAVRDADGAGDWIIGSARSGGAFPAIRKLGNQATWGELRVSTETARLEPWGPLPHGTDEVSLDPSSVAYLSPAGKVQVRRSGPSFTFEPGPEEAFLLGDGRNLFLLSRSGRLTHLLAGVAAGSSPPATDS